MNCQAVILFVSVVLLAGCDKPTAGPIESADELDRYATSSGIRVSHVKGLRDELARLESEGATAAQLSAGGFTVPTALGNAHVGRDSAANSPPQPSGAALQAVLTPELQESLGKQLDSLYPVGPFKFSATALQAAVQLKDRYDGQRQRIHAIIASQDRGFQIPLSQGLAVDTSFTEVATIGNRLSAIAVAELLYRNDPSAALNHLREMISTIEALAGAQHVVPRIVAVHRRGEALRVLEAIVTHPSANATVHEQLARLIDDQLAGWPSDDVAWIGDRAVGMHTYELVRDGYLLSILNEDEQTRLRREVGFKRLAKQVAKNLDQDELFYLRAMRKTIAACRQPYFERERVFRDIARQLDALDDSLDYPLVTDLVLWPDVQEGHRLQALDRARCEAWSLALAASLDAPRPPYRINPLTGTRYIMDLRADQVIVDGIDPQHGASPIVIPRRPSLPD